MDKKTDRQLDVWGIYRDPEHIYDALRIILEHKDKINTPLKLYKNCTSKFIVDGEEIGRYMSTFVCSYEADIALLLSNVEREKYITGIGKDSKEYDLEAIATPEIIETFFKKYAIPYEIIDVKNEQTMVNDNEIPETWFARADYVLIDALRESHSKGCDKCIFYPSIDSKLSLGYYLQNGTFEEIWGSDFKGLIETDNNWTFLTNENFHENLNRQGAIQVIESLTDESGKNIDFKYDIDENGRPKELDRILVCSRNGECPADTFMNYVRLCMDKQKYYIERGEEIPAKYLISDKVYLSDESVKYFINSQIVDLIGASKDGKQLQFYWKDSEKLPALEVKLQLDEQKNQYAVVFIKEDAKGDYKGFEWNRENALNKGSIVQIYRKEDSSFGEER